MNKTKILNWLSTLYGMNLVEFPALQLMIRLIALLVLTSLVGCTVTKRVHRPGFHVEWRKSKTEFKSASVSKDQRKTKQYAESASTSKESSIESRIKENLSEPQPLKTEIQETNIERVIGARDTQSNESSPLDRKADTDHDYAPKAEKKDIDDPQVRLESDESGNENLIYNLQLAGIIIASTGVLLLMGSILTYFGFFSLIDVFYALVFSGNGFIASIFGFLLFLIIAVALIAMYAIVRYVLGGYTLGFIFSGALFAIGGIMIIVASFVI